MQRLTYILILLIAAALPGFGRASQGGYCSQGGVTGQVSTGGFTVAPKMQASYPGCTVTVYLTGTLTLATIYSDSGGTGKANPFTADVTTGYWFFYANNGRYDVKMNGGGIVTPFTLGGIQFTDITSVTWTSPLVFSGDTASCPTCVVTSGSYTNPSWITSIAQDKITGSPWSTNGNVVYTTDQSFPPIPVGIGTMTPVYTLDVQGNSRVLYQQYLSNASTHPYLMYGAVADSFTLADDANNWLVVNASNGHVGIGGADSTPDYMLDVSGSVRVQDRGGSGVTQVFVRAGTSQTTSSLQLFRNSSDTTLAEINYLGEFVSPQFISVGASDVGSALNGKVSDGLLLSSTKRACWSSVLAWFGTADLCLARSSASTLEVGNNSGGYGNVVVGNLTVSGTCTGCGGGGGGGVTLDTAQTIIGQKTFSATILASAGVTGTVFNSTVTGSTIAFQTLSGAGAQINGAGNISTAESIVATKFITTSEWFGLPRYSTVEPTTDPSGTFSGLAYKGGTSGLEIWLWDDVNSAWSDIDLASVAGGLTSINGQTGPAITIAQVANRTVVTQSMDTITISLPQDIATTSSVTFGNVTSPGTFNSTIAGAGVAFQAGGGTFQVDGTGNISGAGNVIATGYVTSATWLGLKDYAATPGTTPGTTYSALAYKGGVSGLEVWLWDDVHTAWTTIDLAGVAGGISSINGQTGPGISIAQTPNQVLVSTLGNVITLSTPQSIATTSNPTFASLTANGTVQAVGSGAGIAFQTTTGGGSPAFRFQVDFNGNVSANGNLNLTGGSGTYQMGGVTVINASRNATFNNLTVSGTCTGCSGGVSSINSQTGAILILPTSSQVNVNTVGTNITLSLPQSIGTGNTPQFAGLLVTGAFNSSVAAGAGIAYQISNGLGTPLQINGNGFISARGELNLTGAGVASYKMLGNVVINNSGAFVGAGVNVCSGFSTPCPNGIGARAFNPYDGSGTIWTGQDYTIGTSGGNLTVNGTPVTSIKFVGGSLVSYTP